MSTPSGSHLLILNEESDCGHVQWSSSLGAQTRLSGLRTEASSVHGP